MGFFEDLIKDLELWGAVQASKDKNGKPDPYKAAGIAAGMGNFSWSDQAMLAGMLGSQGAFDDDIPNHDYDINFDYLDPNYDKTPAEDVKDWQITAELNDYGISPFDYDTEEEYLEAVAEAEADAEEDEEFVPPIVEIPIKIALDFAVEIPALDRLDAIKECDFPNKRMYEAACEKVKLETGLILGLDEKTKEHNIRQCDFILEYHDKYIAAKYLSIQLGEFLYAQAVKENFDLPFNIPDEDEQMVTPVDDLFRQIHKKCKKQLFPIWKWLIENFVPYMDYSSDNGYSLSTGVIANGSYIDDKFISEFANYITENKFFGKVIMELSPSLDNEYGTLFAHLLKNKHFDLVKEMFKICANKDIDSAHICGVIYGFMEACSNYNELETMELFEQHIFPIIKVIDKPDIQDNISAWEDEIKEYYNYCEDNCEQYQFTRKNAWRKQHKKEAEKLGLNVLYYDSEEEYLQDYNAEKYSWRDSYTTDDTYGLNPSDFESEDALNKAISKKIEQEEKQAAKEYKLAEETTSTIRTQAQSRQNTSYSEDMKRFEDDTIYTFIGVLFPYTSHHYHYLTDDDSITIGDYVVVPVGVDNKESVAKVVSVEKHLRISAPFPVEKTKKIISKYVKNDTPLKNFRLISNNICYGPCPDADEEVEQHLTILSDGRVWFSRYKYGLGDGKYELEEKKQVNIGKDIAVDILTFTKKYFDEKGIVMKCTDVGIWELFLTDENDAKYTIDGSVVPNDYTSEISNYIRERLPLENLFLFDGNI